METAIFIVGRGGMSSARAIRASWAVQAAFAEYVRRQHDSEVEIGLRVQLKSWKDGSSKCCREKQVCLALHRPAEKHHYSACSVDAHV